MSGDAFGWILVLCALALAGIMDLVGQRDMYRFNARQEWRVREAWYRSFTNNEELIQRARRQFFWRKGLKVPKGK